MPSNAETAVARTIGIDTGKNTLHMIGLDEKGAIVLREKVSRTRIAARFVNLPPCLVSKPAWRLTTWRVSWSGSVTKSSRCHQPIANRSGRVTRTTSEMRTRSQKL